MNYVKTENGTVIEYPYATSRLRRENPNTSFPSEMPDSLLAEYGVFPVHAMPKPAPRWYQRIEETPPKKINGDWVQQWQVIDVSTDEREELILQEWGRLRGLRNGKLAGCDWTQLSDSPVDKAAWATYRQALRNLPQATTNPFEVVWPQEPMLPELPAEA